MQFTNSGRWMRLLLLVAVLLVLPLSVQAGVDFCSTDPIVLINGQQYNIIVGVPKGNVKDVSGPVRVNIVHPSGVPAQIVFIDTSVFEYKVKLNASGGYIPGGSNDIRVNVDVPTVIGTQSFPVQVVVQSPWENKTLIGDSKTTTTLKMKLK
jgi:hypothetical protein